MKKITFTLAACLIAAVGFAQTTFSYNTDATINAANSVGCPGGDNNWARNFLIADFPTTPAEFQITGGEFGVQSSGGVDETVTVNVYSSDADFPTGITDLIGTADFVVIAGTEEEAFEFTFDPPIAAPSGVTAILMEVSTELGEDFFIGGTSEETAECYLKSENCTVADYVTATSIGFEDAHFYMTLNVEELLSVGDNLADIVSIYPNPATSVLNVNVPSNFEINNASLYDMLGKRANTTISNGQINVSDLATGVYMLSVETTAGTLTEKVIIE